MLKTLNTEQAHAAEVLTAACLSALRSPSNPSKPAQVFALFGPAGTGKTMTLSQVLRSVIEAQGVKAERPAPAAGDGAQAYRAPSPAPARKTAAQARAEREEAEFEEASRITVSFVEEEQ